MKRQKVLITSNEEEINTKLSQGWTIVSVTPQHITSGTLYTISGSFLIVFEKEISEPTDSSYDGEKK